MLPKNNRVLTKEVETIFKKGFFINSSSLTFKYIKNGTKNAKVSFIAPKNIAKLAVKRNSLRRKGYSVLKQYIDQFPVGIIGVFMFKKFQDDKTILENEIKSILTKIN